MSMFSTRLINKYLICKFSICFYNLVYRIIMFVENILDVTYSKYIPTGIFLKILNDSSKADF